MSHIDKSRIAIMAREVKLLGERNASILYRLECLEDADDEIYERVKELKELTNEFYYMLKDYYYRQYTSKLLGKDVEHDIDRQG